MLVDQTPIEDSGVALCCGEVFSVMTTTTKAQGDPNRIPLAQRRHCDQCGEVLDTTANGVARRCSGAWVPNRSGGGANALVAPVYEDVYLCRACVKQVRAGHVWQQQRLGL